jgi:hypothetical protein
MINPNPGGVIYYALDDVDPRVRGSRSVQGEPGVLVPEDAPKRVLVPTADIGQSWRSQPFDDSRWMSGAGGVGYEKNAGFEPYFSINVAGAMYSVNTSCYVRIPFALTAADLQDLSTLALQVRYDDGFISYLNGVEVARDRFVGTPQWNSVANDSHARAEAVTLIDFNVAANAGLLRSGANLLAIHALNASVVSSDFLISVKLVTDKGPPKGDPSISPTAASYASPIPLRTTTRVKARILDRGQWSALAEAVYTVP